MKFAWSGRICASALIAVAGSPLFAQSSPTAAFDPATIVPKGRISTYTHGTFPAEGQLTHAGIDIAAPCASSAVQAWQDGTVADVVSSVDDPNFDSLGYMVLLDHGVVKEAGKRTYSLYLHLNEPPRAADGALLQKNDTVGRGSRIGVVGATRAAQGCHLHFELRHFAGRFHPVWKNIYGKGDRRKSQEFLAGWSDPQRVVLAAAPVQAVAAPDGEYVTTYSPPKNSLKGIVNLPEPSRILPDSTECSRDQLATLERLANRRVHCYGKVEVAGTDYVLAQNWLATVEDPGRMQLVRNGKPLGSIAAMPGGWIAPVLTRSGNFEILSIAPRGGVAKTSLPYLRYRIGPKGVSLIPGNMFAAGKSPVDEDRRQLQAATRTAANSQVASDARPAPQPAAPAAGSNPHCRFAQWTGDVPNIADLFLCDETRAIETFSRGARFVLKPDAVRFADGKYLVRMTLRPSATSASINRMQDKFNWNDWVYATQNIASTEVFCAFNSNPVAKGQTAVVSGKLDTYTASRIILVCSRT